VPKQVLQITNFAGGLNAYSDARDIEDNQFVQNWNAVVDKNGIIRVSGMAETTLGSEYFGSQNFKPGYGLFQFTSDYEFSGIESNFNSGIATGTIDTVTSTTVFILEDAFITSSANETYDDMIVYIYAGAGSGQSRKVSSYVGSSRTLTTTAAFSTALNDKDDANPSKYMIYRWTPSTNFKGDGTNYKDWIDDVYSNQEEYCIVSKTGTITSAQSKDLGYIEYEPNLSLFSGVEYTVEYTVDLSSPLTLNVADGSKTGSSTNNYGDLSPFIELYSSTIADTGGSIKTLSDTTPSVTAWEASKKHYGVLPDDNGTSAKGYGAVFDIYTDASGNPTFYFTKDKGFDFVAGETLTFTDPGSTSNTAEITVGSINVTGLSLIASENMSYKWLSGIGRNGTTSGYIYNPGSNYIDNGDFRDNYNTLSTTGVVSNESTVSATDSSVTLTVDTTAATETLLLHQSLYKSDGTFIGICDSVNSTTEIVFSKGVDVDIANDTVLYVQEWDIVRNPEAATSDFANHGLTVAQLSGSSSVDNTASGAKLTTSIFGSNGNALSQTVQLHEHTSYSLDFLYHYTSLVSSVSGHGNAIVQVINPETEEVLFFKNLTSITTSLSDGFGNEKHHPNYSGIHPVSNQTTDGPIFFTTPASRTTSDTMPIKIQFGIETPHPNTFRFFLHGVTLYKNYFNAAGIAVRDFSNTSQSVGVDSNNPFHNHDESTYKFNFIIPKNYTDVTNWKFRIHAGKFGYGGDQGEDNSTVKIKNFKITSNRQVDKDVITMLLDNKQNSSAIHLHNSKSSSWTLNYINWGDSGAEPNYDYINGMLKISDGNFNTGNKNKLVYYSNRTPSNSNSTIGWTKTEEFLVSPPSTAVFQINEDPESAAVFDLSTYFNELFTGKTYRQNETTKQTNWPMGAFGDITYENENSNGIINPTGMVIRCFTDGSRNMSNGRNGGLYSDTHSACEITQKYKRLPDPNSQWYIDNIIEDNSINVLNSQYGTEHEIGLGENSSFITDGFGTNTSSPRKILTNLGINTSDAGASHRVGGVATNVHDSKDKVRNPLSLIVDPQALEGLTDDAGNEIGNLKEIDIKFKYDVIGFASDSTYIPNGPALPIFKFQGGVASDASIDSSSESILNKMIRAEDFTFDTARAQSTSDIGNICSEPTSHIGQKSIWDVCRDGYLERYDTTGKLLSATLERGEYQEWDNADTHGNAHGCKPLRICLDIEDKIQFNNHTNTISPSDYILIKLEEIPSHGGTNVAASAGLEKTMLQMFGGNYASGTHGYINYVGNNDIDNREYPYGPYNPWKNVTMYTRFVIDRFQLKFYNKDAEVSDIPLNGSSLGVNFSFGASALEGLGWANKIFEFATTVESQFNEESGFSSITSGIGENVDNPNVSYIDIGHSPHIRVKMLESYLNNSNINKTKFYMRDTESEIWYLQFYIDHKTKTMHSTTSSIKSDSPVISSGEAQFFLDRTAFINYNEVNSYESETMVSQEDAVSSNTLTARYKCSVVANSRLYVGNIMQDGEIHGDRMLKSPIGKYNILPKSNFIDVAINDGDEITALAYYKDKLLQYKKRKVFVINVSGDFEFLEDTFENVGVLGQHSVVKTPYGIVWANKTGCYIYDGSSMNNLIDNRIAATSDYDGVGNNYWIASASTHDGACVVGYIQDRDTLIVRWTSGDISSLGIPDSATYHFPTKSWIYNHKSIAGNSSSGDTGKISNMITNVDGDVLYYRHKDGDASINGIKKWNNASTVLPSGGTKLFYFRTKDFTFGNVANRKKIYKVYITYKVGTDGTDSGVSVYAQKNGLPFDTGTFSNNIQFKTSSKFAGTSTVCYASETLDETDGNWKTAELKFASPSEANNIYSFQLLFYASTVAADFEINDISIVFKTKRVK